MDAVVRWDRGLTFTGTADTGFTVPLGTETELGGANDGFKPIELLLVGLAGCTAMDTISILVKKRQRVTGFEVKVHAERAEQHPRVFTDIAVEYIVRGRGIDPAAVERAIELSATKYCPAQSMFGKIVPIRHAFHIVEEEAAAV